MSAVAAVAGSTPRPALRWLGGIDGAFDRRLVDDAAHVAIEDCAPAFASDPESLLLVRCAAQIAAEAGAGALVHAVGALRQAALLREAIDDAVATDQRRGRCIVYLPRTAVATCSADALVALFRDVATRHGEDTLLVVAVAASNPTNDASASASRRIDCGVPVVERLARIAGWEICQLWSDGTARHALVVLERARCNEAVRAS